MINYEYRNLQPATNDQKLVTGITFTIFATDINGDVAEATWTAQYAAPLAALDTFSEADLTALCKTFITDNAVRADLDRVLALRKGATVLSNPSISIAPVQAPVTDAEHRAELIENIDYLVAQTYDRFQRFTMEYIAREKAAQDFKAAGYVGDPTIWITHVAENLGVTNQETADLIIKKADAMRAAIILLGQLRMDKYKIASALTIEDARTVYLDIVARQTVIDASLI
jgi:hypothetical protein